MAAGFATPGLSQMIQPMVDISKSFIGQMKAAIVPFEQMADIASMFVRALDPALVNELGRRFRDLNAVIGIAMRPIVEVAREVTKSLADHLVPIMKKLEPLIQEISDAIGKVLIQSFDDMSIMINGMMPTLKALKDIFVGLIGILQDVWSTFTAVGRGVAEMFKSLIGGAVGEGKTAADIMKQLRDAVREAIKHLLIWSARLMMSFGWAKGVESLINGLEKSGKAEKKDSTGYAVESPSFKAIGDLAKNIQLEAFRASAYGDKEKKDPAQQAADFLGDIKNDLKQVLADGGKTTTVMIDKIHEIIALVKEKWPTVENIQTSVDEARKWLDGKKDEITQIYNDVKNVAATAARFAGGVTNAYNKASAIMSGFEMGFDALKNELGRGLSTR